MIDHTSAVSVLTGVPSTRHEPTTERLDCEACGGTGYSDGPGPLSTPCSACAGTGGARCRDCASPATVRDADTAELGPACEDCATRCYHGCGEVATRLVLCADEDGHETESRSLCERCAEEEPERAARIRRAAWREDDGRGDWMRAQQRDAEVA